MDDSEMKYDYQFTEFFKTFCVFVSFYFNSVTTQCRIG